MTEQEWLSSKDPENMFTWLQASPNTLEPKILGRHRCLIDSKLVCFVEELERLWYEWRLPGRSPYQLPGVPTHYFKNRTPIEAVRESLRIHNIADDRPREAVLLREIFGNPYHEIGIEPAWCTSNVTGIAQNIYDNRDYTAMPILADALEDAGCTDEMILQHCRGKEKCWSNGCEKGSISYWSQDWDERSEYAGYSTTMTCNNCAGTGWCSLRGPHVKGCWVVDLVLGKK